MLLNKKQTLICKKTDIYHVSVFWWSFNVQIVWRYFYWYSNTSSVPRFSLKLRKLGLRFRTANWNQKSVTVCVLCEATVYWQLFCRKVDASFWLLPPLSRRQLSVTSFQFLLHAVSVKAHIWMSSFAPVDIFTNIQVPEKYGWSAFTLIRLFPSQ